MAPPDGPGSISSRFPDRPCREWIVTSQFEPALDPSGGEAPRSSNSVGRNGAEINSECPTTHVSHVREQQDRLAAAVPREVSSMLITTTNDVPGHRVVQVHGEVFGLTVRSRNVGSQIGAAFKSLAGGELKGMTKNLESSRQEAINRLTAAAEEHGANAILAMRFDTTEIGDSGCEVCAYGTACTIAPA
jgi:uncharacterized protein YbjQ (UPF0145 family)